MQKSNLAGLSHLERRKINLNDFDYCLICSECVKYGYGQLLKHLRKKHSIKTSQEYYDLMVLDNVRAHCFCGCDRFVSWSYGNYACYIQGHSTKGQTKETNECLRRHGESVSRTLSGVKKSDKHKRSISETLKGKYKTGEIVSGFTLLHADPIKDSEARKKARITRRTRGVIFSAANYKQGYFFSTKLQQNIPYNSSWELERMEQLDTDQNVLSWSRCRDSIPYVHPVDFKEHFYNPDFIIEYVDKILFVEEIKGYIEEVCYAKTRAAVEYYRTREISYRLLSKMKNDRKEVGRFVDCTQEVLNAAA